MNNTETFLSNMLVVKIFICTVKKPLPVGTYCKSDLVTRCSPGFSFHVLP